MANGGSGKELSKAEELRPRESTVACKRKNSWEEKCAVERAGQQNGRKVSRLTTWNLRTLYRKGKFENVNMEMKRLNIDIMGLSEVRWTQSGIFRSDDLTMMYSGKSDVHEAGVGILLQKEVAKSLMGFYAVSERVIMIKLKGKPFNYAIIQVYAPTSSSTEEEIDRIYSEVEEAKQQCGSQEVVIVVGDLNAKVGQDRYQSVVGNCRLGVKNERGERWMEWFRNAAVKVKSYPGADCDSDHVPVVGD
ncbi:craniofacial development protein 2-like [Penaeus vannamei]|uniref:craniofacial development protein 2-like n=1 Tax=Penaeus vannamei TaxID=6689 RepID=UPI00387F7457